MSKTITNHTASTLFVDQADGTWTVAAGGSIEVANGHGISNDFKGSVISVAGDIIAGATNKSGVYSNGLDASLQVEKSGTVLGYNGLAFWGDGTSAENLGNITAKNIGIYANTQNFHISNKGTIDAKSGIVIDAAIGEKATIENTGLIKGDNGIVTLSGDARIVLGATSIINANVTAVILGDNEHDFRSGLKNEGTINSKNVAILGGSGGDYITNTGTIKGKIVLGEGNDSFMNLDGKIDQAIDGGAGDDLYGIHSTSDKIIDASGHDSIIADVTFSLNNYATIEALFLYGEDDLNGTGNALVNEIYGNRSNNVLNGGDDDVVDYLDGGSGNDTYVLGSGLDFVRDRATNDFEDGGNDTITSTISRSLADSVGVENLKLLGSGNLNGTGAKQADTISGTSGNNILDGGLESNDMIDTLKGGAGNDTYVLGTGHDKVIDSSGVDTITSLISRNLSTFATIENLKLLGASNIDATGNALANTLTGNAGMNTLSGSAGNDVLNGGAGADKLDGGSNTDTASYAGASAGVTANLAAASANTGDAKGDTYASIENLTGSSHNDTLTGNTGANVLFGGAGSDKLSGGTGADTFLFKAVGDSMTSGAKQDTIYDFSHSGGDKISLSGIDADTVITGDQGFVFKGTAAFSGAHGELRFEKMASDTYVYGDTNGDKVADVIIHFDDAISFQGSDFIL